MPSDDFLDAAKSIKLSDFKELHRMPCAATAFTNAIVAGMSVGGLQLFLRASPMKASSWAVGVFAGVSIVIWEACRYKRLQERQHIKEAVIKVEAKRRARKEQQQLGAGGGGGAAAAVAGTEPGQTKRS